MDSGHTLTPMIRFGVFTLDWNSKELRKAGRKISLQGQPLEILLALLEKPGEIVSRSDLQKRLWADNTYVDFEHGLNKAISKIRAAINDSPDNPRFLETIPGEGYRFVAPVQWVAPPTNENTPDAGHRSANLAWRGNPRRRTIGVGITCAAVFLALGVGWHYRHLRSSRHIVETKLTSRVPELSVEAAALSPDGKYLAFADTDGLWLELVEKREMHQLDGPKNSAVTKISWLPDSTTLLVSATAKSAKISAIWAVSIFGGTPRKLRIRDDAGQGSASADGGRVAFTRGDSKEIWTMTVTGEEAQRVAIAGDGDEFGGFVWSRDGRSLVNHRIHQDANTFGMYLEWRSLATGKVAVLLSDHGLRSFCGTGDGTIIYSSLESPYADNTNLWKIQVDMRSGQVLESPKQLTHWAGYSLASLSLTEDGRQLGVEKGSSHLATYALRLETQQNAADSVVRLTFHDRDDYPGSWDQASRAIFLNSNRSGVWEIFKQDISRRDPEYFVGSTAHAKYPVLSPDGRWILYQAFPKSNTNWSTPIKLLRVPASGGPPQSVYEGIGFYRIRCARASGGRCVLCTPSSDGKRMILSDFDPIRGKGKELADVSTSVTMSRMYLSWALAPDGTQIVLSEAGDNNTRLRVISLAGLPEHEVVVNGWRGFQTISWSADGKGFFLLMGSENGSTILRVGLDGHARVLLQRNRPIDRECVPSPDGRWLAFAEVDSNTNVSLIAGF